MRSGKIYLDITHFYYFVQGRIWDKRKYSRYYSKFSYFCSKPNYTVDVPTLLKVYFLGREMKFDVTDSTAKPKVSDPACLKPTVGPWEMFARLLDGIGRSCCGKEISCHYYMPF